jgi:hypothetical protein
MFETISCMIQSIVRAQPGTADSFEGILFPSFQAILGNDVADFVPYVIQVSFRQQTLTWPMCDFNCTLLALFKNLS